MWSNKEADFFPEINKSFTFPGMGLKIFFRSTEMCDFVSCYKPQCQSLKSHYDGITFYQKLLENHFEYLPLVIKQVEVE